MDKDFLKKMLQTFAVIIFIVALTLAIYYGVVDGNEIITTGQGAYVTVEKRFNFGLFLIHFLKWIAIGMFGGGTLLALANKVEDF